MKKLDSIVIIDDDPICSWLNKTFLEDLQVASRIECFPDGLSALEYFNKACEDPKLKIPELILLDINMPGIDGFQFLEKLKALEGSERLAKTRIVFLTTSMHIRDLEKAQELEAYGYLVKPLNEKKILELVNSISSLQSDAGNKLSSDAMHLAPHDRLPVEKAAQAPMKEKNKKEKESDL